ncbi:glycosyltransferase [bacterium]|nr:glycosyltransferase [bacterium]
MKLLLLNDSYFGDVFRRLGHEVLHVGVHEDADVQIDSSSDLRDVIRERGFEPDAALLVDSINRRVFFEGLHELPCPTAWYAVDAPINTFWQQSYAHGFDRVYVDQLESFREMRKHGVEHTRWLPLAADNVLYHPPRKGAERDLDVVFVGTMDYALRPKRSAILYRLKRVANVTLVDGGGTRSMTPYRVAKLYRRAKIILNELLFDGVNLRTFEAMACGAVVLTERGRGEQALFEEGRHLAGFGTEDLEQVVLELLRDDEKRRQIGRTGAEEIRNKHTLVHRAARIMKDFELLEVRADRDGQKIREEIAWAKWAAGLKWPDMPGNLLHAREYIPAHPLHRASVLELRRDIGGALETMHHLWEKDKKDDFVRVKLAALLWKTGRPDLAASLLGKEKKTPGWELHSDIGWLLLGLGHELQPGFNLGDGPVLMWNAFEHFRQAMGMKPDHLPAIEGLDRVLAGSHAAEFAIGIWQNYHARHPNDPLARDRFLERARQGYHTIPASLPTVPTDRDKDVHKQSRAFAAAGGGGL